MEQRSATGGTASGAAGGAPGRAHLVRAIGFWGLVAMCINAVVGSGVFLLPSASYDLLGRFAAWAPLLFALPVFVLVLCFAEAASCFTQPGGAYLYAGTAFGDMVGFGTGWMNWIARITSLAALANGFVVSLARLWPTAGETWPRAALIVGSLALLAGIHALGVRYGAATIYVLTVGKLLPLLIFIGVALVAMPYDPIAGSFTLPGEGTRWNEAALLLLFAYAGFENLGVPAGEYRDPRKHLPLALLVGILGIATVYALAQLAAMASLPDLGGTDTPIADAAAALMGPAGALLVTVGAMVSILGTNSGTMLEGSRLLYSLAVGRRPYRFLTYVHPQFRTPLAAIALHALVAMPVALAGSFTKLALLSAVARMTTYLVTCAALPRLRRIASPQFRAPGGLLLPILGVVISLTLFLTLNWKHLVAAALALTLGAILWLIAKLFPGAEGTLAERAAADAATTPVTADGRRP
jgi:APA family basic amino acid/polyamine antiporter